MRSSYIKLHIAVLLAGFTAVLGKLIGLNEGILVWYRLLFSAAILAIILLYKKAFAIDRKLVGKVALTGCLIATHWVAFYGSVKYGNISIAVVCLSAMAFFTSIVEPLFFKRKIDVVEMLLGLMSIIGIAIFLRFSPDFRLGIIFGIAAALFSAIFPVLNKQLVQQMPPLTLSFYEYIFGLAFLTLLLPVFLHFFPASYYVPTTADLLWLVVMSLFCTVIAMALGLSALKKISAFTSNLTYNLEPIYGVLMGFLFFNESKSFNASFYICVTIIITAIVIQMWRSRPKIDLRQSAEI